jgi:mannosyltransferase OCH1-like enzyme
MIHFKNKRIQELKNRQIQQENQNKMRELQEKNQNYLNYKNLNKPFELKEKYNSVIPLNLYTCWHTKELPPLLKSTYEILIKENSEFNHFLYDENDSREFIQQHFDQVVVDAYNSLIPCSYKSDLWRFCILYINGGIYYDIKFRCLNGFKFIGLTENEMFVKDMQENCVLTGLIVSKPGNAILKKCIDQIVVNVKTRFYGENPLYPTGPGLLGTFFTNEEQKKLSSYFYYHLFDELKLFYIVYNNGIILQFNNNNYRSEQNQYQKNTHYHDLWHSHNIYI